MPKVTISYEFASEGEAQAFLAGGGRAAPGGTTTGAAPPPNAPRTAPAAPAAAPPPSAPATAAPPPSAPPPAPPPAPAAAPANALLTETLAAMQAYGKSPHKAAGIKRVLARVGLTAIKPDVPPETLEWLKSVMSPQADGSFMTPEAIEAL